MGNDIEVIEMQVPNDVLMKFPVIFREKLINKEIELQDNVEFEYDDIQAYRCVDRKKGDNSEISREDFKSNAEKGRKNIRGETGDVEKKPEYYGVSFYEDKAQLVLRLRLPQKNRKIARGYICREGGPILRGHNTHVCWWLFEDADVSGFEIENGEE